MGTATGNRIEQICSYAIRRLRHTLLYRGNFFATEAYLERTVMSSAGSRQQVSIIEQFGTRNGPKLRGASEDTR